MPSPTTTYTVLVTITESTFTPQSLAQRIAAQLETGSADHPPVVAATVDAFVGDHLGHMAAPQLGDVAKMIHATIARYG